MLVARNRTTPTLRVAVLALAVLQIGASVVFPSADAVLEAETFGTATHVESPGNEDCATHHDHLFCQVVRSLASATSAAPLREALAATQPVVRLGIASSRNAAAPSTFLPGSAHPRAPPLG